MTENNDIKNLQISQVEMKSDIKYIRKSIDEMKNTFGLLDDKYVSKEKFNDMYDKEITPMKNNLDRIGWLVISCVIVAILSIILGRNGLFSQLIAIK